MKPGEIQKLLRVAAFPHAVDRLELIETHISWVILTGNFAYKIKKPVNLGFVDFTSLAQRKHYCEEELSLNRRTAPEIYLDVVPIADGPQGPEIGAEPAVEYAVKMRQFHGDARLDRQLAAGRLGEADMPALAEVIARFHASLDPESPNDAAREVAHANRFALENFDQIRAALDDSRFMPLLAGLEAWTRRQLDVLQPEFDRRVSGGLVREGHGDLHLANIVRFEEHIVLFDCLEFDPGLRRLDLMNDVAFLVMDLMAHERRDLAFVFLNDYLEKTGDYGGLAVLRYYLVYRSLVRAKVAAMQPNHGMANGSEAHNSRVQRYLDLAGSLADPPASPHLLLMHGLSGAGKSWVSGRLVGALGAIRIRSDLERKRLHGLAPGQSSHSGIESGLYEATATDRTYERLAQYCEAGLRAGFDMIVDASFLRLRERRRFTSLANRLQAKLFVLDCTAAIETLRKRLRQRDLQPREVSEAGLAVLEHQLSHRDLFTPAETPYVVTVSTDKECDMQALLKRLDFRAVS